MYIKRATETLVKKYSEQYPIIMIIGPYQIGKTTLLNHIKEDNRGYVSLDDEKLKIKAKKDPISFLKSLSFPIIIDEFSYVPQLLLALNQFIDELRVNQKETKGLIWLAGTLNKSLNKVKEILGDKLAIVQLTSLSYSEIEGNNNKPFNPDIEAIIKKDILTKLDTSEIFALIFQGGMPKVISEKMNIEEYYQSFLKNFLEKYIKGLSHINSTNMFLKFLKCMAGRTSQELKYSSISRDVGVSQPTIKRWVLILESYGVIYLLQPYQKNKPNRIIKSPKIYFMDTGLSVYLSKWEDPKSLEQGAMNGSFFENYVVTEIVKSYVNNGVNPPVFYYRDREQREIDLLIETKEYLYPIEIKKNTFPTHAVKHFYIAERFGLKVKNGIVLCMTDEIIPTQNNKSFLVPISYI